MAFKYFVRKVFYFKHSQSSRKPTLWVGTRPATAKNGVIIYYNKYDEIYFSPSDNEAFVAALLEINPEIKVVR